MGWAKTMEDNFEIMIDRQVMRNMESRDSASKITNTFSNPSNPEKAISCSGIMTKALTISINPDPKRPLHARVKKNPTTCILVETTSHSEPAQPCYSDKILTCKSCGGQFLFSAHAQKEYALNDWAAPKRCKTCRDFRKAISILKNSH